MKMPSELAILILGNLDGIEALELEPEEAFVLTRVNGQSTLKEISQILGYDPARTWKLVTRAVDGGFLQVKEPAQEKPFPKSSPQTPAAISVLKQLDEEENDPVLSQIPRSKRSEILLRHHAMSQQTHYELFGVDKEAKMDKIRSSYFSIVKNLHPDRFYGKKLGRYTTLLEELFGRVTLAYETLADATKRKIYDHGLSEVEKKKNPTGPKEPQPPAKLTGKTLIERFALAKKYHDMARQEEDAGNGLKAAGFYNMALQFEPENEKYKKAFDRMAPFVLRKKADDLFKKAEGVLDYADYDTAIQIMEEALEIYPRKRECYRELPLLYLKKKKKLDRARELAEKALTVFNKNPDVHVTLGCVYLELKMNDQAKKQFKAALEIDKSHEGAQEGLRLSK